MDGPPAPVRVLPDGCMDLIAMNGRHRRRRAGYRAVDDDARRRTLRRLAVSARHSAPVTRSSRRRDSRPSGAPSRICGGPPPRPRSLTELTARLAAERAEERNRAVDNAAVEAGHRQSRHRVDGRRPGTHPSAGRRAPCSASAPPSTATVPRLCGASCVSGALGDCSTRGLPSPTSPPARAMRTNRICTVRSARSLACRCVVWSGRQRREQIHPVAVRVGHRRIALPPRRVVRLQQAGITCRGDLLVAVRRPRLGCRRRTPA